MKKAGKEPMANKHAETTHKRVTPSNIIYETHWENILQALQFP